MYSVIIYANKHICFRIVLINAHDYIKYMYMCLKTKTKQFLSQSLFTRTNCVHYSVRYNATRCYPHLIACYESAGFSNYFFYAFRILCGFHVSFYWQFTDMILQQRSNFNGVTSTVTVAVIIIVYTKFFIDLRT